MSSIKLAGNYIAATDTPLAGRNRNSGHLQIVYDDGVPATLLIEAEVQAPTLVFAGDWDFQPFGQAHGDPTDYISDDDTIENADRYAITTIALQPYQTAENVWDMLRSVHDALSTAAPGLDYDVDQNSNSYVRTALYAVGIDLDDSLMAATPADVAQFPGANTNVLLGSEQGFSSNVPIDLDLSGANSGTAGADFIRTGIGNDIIEGGGGDDRIDGGDQRDGGADIAIFSGECLEYDISRANDGTITITHARPSGATNDGTDTLTNIEVARFANADVDLTVEDLVGCTLISIPSDLVRGEGSLISQDWSRTGQLNYSFTFFNDGEFIRPSDFFFVDSNGAWLANVSSLNWGIVPIGRSEFGPDELVEVTYTVVGGDGLQQAVMFSVNGSEPSDTAVVRYLSIGESIDDRGGQTFGDPHLITFDNVAYDFQAAGDFILARAKEGPAYEVQARFVALSSAISVTEAMATTVDGIVVSLQIDGGAGILLIDGVSTALTNGESVLVGAGTVSRTGRRFEVDHGNGDTTTVDVFSRFLNVTPSPSLARSPGSLEGLLGDADGNPANDFQLANETVLSTPLPVETLYGSYAASWLVADGESILPGAPENYDAPDRIITIDSLPEALRLAAEAAVDAAGITNSILREAAILDFALTGNAEFIEAAELTDGTFDPIVDTVAVDPVSNPVVVLTTDTTVLNEEDAGARSATLTVARGSSDGDLSVNYSITGSGANPADANDFLGGIISGEVIIEDGEDAATFEVEIIDDSFDEGIEDFDVTISLNEPQASSFELLVSSVRMTVEDDENQDPELKNDDFSVDEDLILRENVLTNDSDPNGDTLTVVAAAFTTTQGATVILNDDGSFEYTPAQNFNGTDSFEYTAEDGQGGSDTATVSIEVLPVNDDPVAESDEFSGIIAQPVNGNVLGNDRDIDGDTLNVLPAELVTAQGGSVSILSDGSFTYDPAIFFLGEDNFEYTLEDGQGGSDTATVALSIGLPDDAVIGTEGRDFLVDAKGDGVMLGLGGRDILIGRKGDDILLGGAGKDRILGGRGDDMISGGTDRDYLSGSSGDDFIFGGDGNDYLWGGRGNDLLSGGAGCDKLFGGRGGDTFLFEQATAFDGKDLIVGFNPWRGDKIDISDLLEAFDPTTDTIGDFVNLSRKGFVLKTLSVDADGGGDGFVEVASIYAFNRMDLQDLVDTGSLVVA